MSFKGLKHSDETKKKMSIALKGKNTWTKGHTPNKGKHWKLSEETKKKMSLYWKGKKKPWTSERNRKNPRKGEKHWNWKGGITPINHRIKGTIQYKLWREAVFKRDNYQCIWGGKEHGNKLNADHIKPFALYPELRFAIDNGRTLCVECHRKTDTFAGKTNHNKKQK